MPTGFIEWAFAVVAMAVAATCLAASLTVVAVCLADSFADSFRSK